MGQHAEAPDAVFEKIDQMSSSSTALTTTSRARWKSAQAQEILSRRALPLNNHSCLGGIQPFGGWAYE